MKAILSLSQALGLHTTAEGIETEDVLERLTKLGCDTGQGYLFGKAVPAAATANAVRERRVAPARRPVAGARSPSGARAPSPSAGLRAAAPIRPWRWSRCPA